ncbi:MAG: hypothetical protein R3C68_08145 [Myxococcota bacterium]
MLKRMQLRRYVKGQKIIEEGIPENPSLSSLGANAVDDANISGKAVNLARFHYVLVFGEMALTRSGPRIATADR